MYVARLFGIVGGCGCFGVLAVTPFGVGSWWMLAGGCRWSVVSLVVVHKGGSGVLAGVGLHVLGLGDGLLGLGHDSILVDILAELVPGDGMNGGGVHVCLNVACFV